MRVYKSYIRFLFSVILVFCYSPKLYAQNNTFVHTLERGECIEMLTERYGVTIEEIKACNQNFDLFYTGMKINIPNKTSKVLEAGTEKNKSFSSSNNDIGDFPADVERQMDDICGYVEAMDAVQELFDSGDYKKAQKQINSIIKRFEGRVDCSDAYYGKALCSYNRKKWKDAIEEFSYVINNTDCDKETLDNSKELLYNARIYRDQQLENRANLLGGLFMTAATVGTAYMVTKANANTNSVVNTSNTSYSNNSYTTSANEESTFETTTKKSSKVCRTCHGDGKCMSCHGKGIRTDNLFGTGADPRYKCGVCGGDGTCGICKGTGKQS